MKLGVFTVLYNEKPLEEVAKYISGLGYETVELAAWRASSHLDIDQVLADSGYRTNLLSMLKGYNLEISAISNHLDGQMILGPLDWTTDAWAPIKDPAEKVKWAIQRMKDTARAAAALGVPVVVGFTGSQVWGHWYSFPEENIKAYEQAWQVFAERWHPILDVFKAEGVKFALEVHPTEIAYNIETAGDCLKAIDFRPEFGFNYDPSHFVWQMIDPVIFIKKFGDRLYHAHAKDSELQEDEIARSGVIPNGPWARPDRGFRFRVPGWGNTNWRRIMTALLSVGYDYVLSYEHEDPVMSREDGCEKNIEFLRPLIIKSPLKDWGKWWKQE
jgi:sugar phosphate isomerase/epimerase